MRGEQSGPERPHGPARQEHAVIDRIQRLVDDLGAALSLPVSVDDHSFRLQFYSPQMGTLDRVRIESILFRDSPEAAKSWVREHGVADARGPVLIPASEELGLLPRVCIPIPHDDAILGYLWIIDADGTLTESGRRRATDSANLIGPLMFRRLFLERLDRAAERTAIAQLVDERDEIRMQGFSALHTSRPGGVLPARVAVVRAVSDASDPREFEARALRLEVALESARGTITPSLLHLLTDDRAVLLLTHEAAERALDERGTGDLLARWLRQQVGLDDIVIGVGRLARNADEIRRSFVEAQDAASIARRVEAGPEVMDARWLGPHRQLLRLAQEDLRDIAHTALDALLQERNESLLATLTVFLDAGGDATAVAEHFGLHRSTIYARVQRLESILEADLSDGNVRLGLHYALIALRLTTRRT